MNQHCLHAQWFFFFLKDVTDKVGELILPESDVSIVRSYCAVNKVKKLLLFTGSEL